MDGNWAANLALACFAVILAAILVNMVIAKINHTYAEVVRKGTLFYYKELFDLRYLYKRDPRYGYLASLEHPLSIVLPHSLRGQVPGAKKEEAPPVREKPVPL